MKVLIVLALTVTCLDALIFGGGCTTDKDCPNNGCCQKQLFANTCKHRLARLSRCSLTATAQSACTSQCEIGLQCVDESSLDIAIEPGYNTGSYGRCFTATSAQPTSAQPVTETTTQ